MKYLSCIAFFKILFYMNRTMKKEKRKKGNKSQAIVMRLMEKVNVCLIDHCLHISIHALAVIKEPQTNTCSFTPARPLIHV